MLEMKDRGAVLKHGAGRGWPSKKPLGVGEADARHAMQACRKTKREREVPGARKASRRTRGSEPAGRSNLGSVSLPSFASSVPGGSSFITIRTANSLLKEYGRYHPSHQIAVVSAPILGSYAIHPSTSSREHFQIACASQCYCISVDRITRLPHDALSLLFSHPLRCEPASKSNAGKLWLAADTSDKSWACIRRLLQALETKTASSEPLPLCRL
jgi:hypothetical protein